MQDKDKQIHHRDTSEGTVNPPRKTRSWMAAHRFQRN